MNEKQADKMIDLLESIDKTQKVLLQKQIEADKMMDAIASRFGQEEEPEEKSTDAFYKQGLSRAAFSDTSPF